MRVVLTRPAHDAPGWAETLRARGHDVLLLPLIEIGPAPDRAAVDAAWRALPVAAAAMFVSANAVRGFFAQAQGPWPPGVRAWSTGPGTTQALQTHGVPLDSIDAPGDDAPQFDSEALWSIVRGRVRSGDAVWIVRGAGEDGRAAGRDWLARELAAAGARVSQLAAYMRRPPAWSDAERAMARAAAADGSVWLFSSSEAIGNLRALVADVDWSRARAIASHERIAQAAREAGFGVVCPSRAGEAGLTAALESFG